ncbi:hypothetical protein [Streptomyces sp. NPDC056169]|uniref:hypothetical protein n=1 Tax=Streptomyces sp. NPDC056169 TaxID=3345734 RepID=UPI0035D57BD8
MKKRRIIAAVLRTVVVSTGLTACGSSAPGPKDAQAVTRQFKDLYAYSACMAPVEAVREPLLIGRRTAFQASHRDELLALRRTVIPRIHELERRYGIGFARPVP